MLNEILPKVHVYPKKVNNLIPVTSLFVDEPNLFTYIQAKNLKRKSLTKVSNLSDINLITIVVILDCKY